MFFGSGYYNYDEGYTPDFPGIEEFGGTVVHPQYWPQDLDYTGKKIVVIGSGATAMSLIPSLAEKAAKVTMLQRSPTYVFPASKYSPSADWLRKVLPGKVAHSIIRQRDALTYGIFWFLSRKTPGYIKWSDSPHRDQRTAGRLRRRHALQAALQPVGPAAVPDPRR